MSRGTDLQSRVATFHLTVPTLALARQAACTNVAELAAARTHTVKTVPDPLLPFFRRPSAFPSFHAMPAMVSAICPCCIYTVARRTRRFAQASLEKRGGGGREGSEELRESAFYVGRLDARGKGLCEERGFEIWPVILRGVARCGASYRVTAIQATKSKYS